MILVTGGTGFVGRNIVRKLVQEGQEVRCLVRKTSNREVLQGLDVEFCEGDITDPATLEGALKGIDVVIHLVGIIREIPPRATFERLHAEGTSNMIAASVKARVKKFVHMSALGTSPEAQSRYHATKWLGELSVRNSGIPFTVFRPSIICGKDDEFVNMFAKIIRQTSPLPFLMVIGSGKVKMQPIFVGDVAHCFCKAATSDGRFINQAYELGGPEELSINEILDTIMKVMGAWRIKIHMPVTAAWPMAYAMEKTCTKPMLTREQLIMLGRDNVGDITAMKRDFQFEPVRFVDAIKTYLKD